MRKQRPFQRRGARFPVQRFPVPGRVAAGLLFLLALAGVAEPAEVPRTPLHDGEIDRRIELQHVEREQVRLVLVPAVVVNRRNKLVSGLQARDFKLFEDFVPMEIEYFGTEASQPVEITFLLDVSGSMRRLGKLDEAKHAIRTFVESLQPEDRIGLISFADEQVAWITEPGSDRERFLRRLEVQEAYGQTALFDALAATPRLVAEDGRGRKAVVLFTDGNDNASRLNTFKAVRLARSVEVPIHIISFASVASGYRPKGSETRQIRTLERFAQETGGSIWPVRDPTDLKEAVLRIQEELRFQYVIGYHPKGRAWDGTFRRLKLETDRDGLTVRSRSGYYADP